MCYFLSSDKRKIEGLQCLFSSFFIIEPPPDEQKRKKEKKQELTEGVCVI